MPALATWVLLLLAAAHPCSAGCITRLPSSSVALTFDACETVTPSYFDTTILDFLIGGKIPFTLFVNGEFVRRNSERLREISGLGFVEIENHSYHHYLHMERLVDETVRREVSDDDDLIRAITGKRTKYFRFPGGNCNARMVRAVEGMHYRVVHWTFASGDPGPPRNTGDPLAVGVGKDTARLHPHLSHQRSGVVDGTRTPRHHPRVEEARVHVCEARGCAGCPVNRAFPALLGFRGGP